MRREPGSEQGRALGKWLPGMKSELRTQPLVGRGPRLWKDRIITNKIKEAGSFLSHPLEQKASSPSHYSLPFLTPQRAGHPSGRKRTKVTFGADVSVILFWPSSLVYLTSTIGVVVQADGYTAKRHCHERPCHQSPNSATKPICHNDLALHKVYVKWGGSVSSKTALGALSVTLGNRLFRACPLCWADSCPSHFPEQGAAVIWG